MNVGRPARRAAIIVTADREAHPSFMPACASDTHDGRSPDAGLTILNGVIYGTTPLGGTDVSRAQGTVFSITTSGNQHVLYNFKCKGSCNDAAPSALTVLKGMLYGTTAYGPAN